MCDERRRDAAFMNITIYGAEKECWTQSPSPVQTQIRLADPAVPKPSVRRHG